MTKNAHDIYNVAYKVDQIDYSRIYPQNADKRVRVRVFTDRDEALRFAREVNLIHIFDGTGKNIPVA